MVVIYTGIARLPVGIVVESESTIGTKVEEHVGRLHRCHSLLPVSSPYVFLAISLKKNCVLEHVGPHSSQY